MSKIGSDVIIYSDFSGSIREDYIIMLSKHQKSSKSQDRKYKSNGKCTFTGNGDKSTTSKYNAQGNMTKNSEV